MIKWMFVRSRFTNGAVGHTYIFLAFGAHMPGRRIAIGYTYIVTLFRGLVARYVYVCMVGCHVATAKRLQVEWRNL